MSNSEGGGERGSILGNPTGVPKESSNSMTSGHTFRYATKLDFPRFQGEDVEK